MNESLRLAHGENLLLPALCGVAAIYSAAIWTLVRSVRGKFGALTVTLAVLSAALGGAGILLAARFLDWPPQRDLLFSLMFWAFPTVAGTLTLFRMRRAKSRRN